MTLGAGQLLVTVGADKVHAGAFMGLLGNFNGNKSDDLILPDGTPIDASQSLNDSFIYHQFGEHCKSKFKACKHVLRMLFITLRTFEVFH